MNISFICLAKKESNLNKKSYFSEFIHQIVKTIYTSSRFFPLWSDIIKEDFVS
jgi:hypothetical protein